MFVCYFYVNLRDKLQPAGVAKALKTTLATFCDKASLSRGNKKFMSSLHPVIGRSGPVENSIQHVTEKGLLKAHEIFMSSLADYSLTFESFARTHTELLAQEAADKLAVDLGDDGVRLLSFGRYNKRTYRSMFTSSVSAEVKFINYL